ncbi:uncharacterized protein LOC128834790 isoform X2 [Malaclemys terrapin pileata]|uniref:uncharacterized protein LOC128834790 isoform X2 n=1 Tax=Malaclemys terrapin pileata TaxID=2991368 RepID=UPI0023A87F55|nr:uncharacterized protein LOC128834790 isoform X2 [Malaclemys terrapin pileata]
MGRSNMQLWNYNIQSGFPMHNIHTFLPLFEQITLSFTMSNKILRLSFASNCVEFCINHFVTSPYSNNFIQFSDYYKSNPNTQTLTNLFDHTHCFRNWYYGEKRTQGVEDEKEIHAYFAESTHIHSPKPESVQFNVGQVIIHRRFGYSGVIVGWDVKARAPEEWLQHKYPPEKQGLRDTPHYRILINQANSFSKSTAYIPEEDITIIMGLEIHNPDLTTYFSRYDGSKYIMQPWLRKIYPHD